jgi:hypothetical protein
LVVENEIKLNIAQGVSNEKLDLFLVKDSVPVHVVLYPYFVDYYIKL